MRRPFLLVGSALVLGSCALALACGSLDIDALGAGYADAGGDGATTGEPPGDGAPGPPRDAASTGDAGWHAPPTEEDATWVPSGWKPQSSGTTSDLETVWGATSKAVWAGGRNGTLLRFDGTAWAPVTSSVAADGTVRAIAGTASDDVYLLEQRGAPNGTMVLHHYDGTGWAEVSTFDGVNEVGCLDAPARRVAYVYGAPKRAAVASAENALRLHRVDGRTADGVRLVGTTSYVAPDRGVCDVHAFAPDDVWLSGSPASRFDGAAFVALPGGAPDTEMLSVVSRTLAFTSTHVWNGATWQSKSIGMPGSLVRVSGRADALAFGAVSSVRGIVLRWAGGAWVEEPLPVDLAATRSVFMAPGGRTFAVGRVGLVWSGP